MKHDQHRWNSWLLNAPNLRVGKRIVVAVIGGTVTIIGIALIVLPGPAFIVIPIGLSILATEFLWAKRWLQKARQMVTHIKNHRMTPNHARQQTVPACLLLAQEPRRRSAVADLVLVREQRCRDSV